jgi:hypothetical protein
LDVVTAPDANLHVRRETAKETFESGHRKEEQEIVASITAIGESHVTPKRAKSCLF